MSPARPSRRTSVSSGQASRRRGFTLIELVAVMMVVGILMALSLGMVRAAKQRASLARARGELAGLTQALERYKAHYGDYPQTGSAAQATPVVTARVTTAQAQALFLNALIGVYGPTNFTARINGPVFVEVSKFKLEVDLIPADATTFGIAEGSPPIKRVQANCLLDPWGNRYMYYYKPAPAAGRPPTNTWRAPGYVLYSVGPDGAHVAPNITTGLFATAPQTSNMDNILATP